MSLDSALLVATSGLRHAARQIANASHNIANAGVDGYTRKQAEGAAVTTGGVRTLEPRRAVDEPLRAEARAARGDGAAAQLRADTLAPLAQLQGDPEDGASLGGLVGTLRDRFNTLRASPADSGAQGEALRATENVASRLNEIATAVSRSRQAVQDGLRQDVDAANGLLREIARLDNAVRAEVAAGRNGAEALDRRDAAVSRLSELFDVTPTQGDRGGVVLILRGGAVLPLDPNGSPLALADAAVPPGPDPLPGLTLNGAPISSADRGGRIGAGFALRDDTLLRMGAELDTVATTLAGRLREQGLTLFTEPGGAAPPTTGSTEAHGFASRLSVSPAVSADPRRLRDGTADVPAFPPNPDGRSGYTALLDRVLNYSFGDRASATADHAAIPGAHAGPAGPLPSSFSPPRRITDYAAAVSAAHASEAGAASGRAGEAAQIASRLTGLLATREGVDVDAEMAAMVTLQNAYAANARVMAAVQGMWDALLGAVR